MPDTQPTSWSVPQRAEVDWRFGRRVRLRTAVEVTPVGLVAIGGLVSGILLSSAVIVHVATRHLSHRPVALPQRGPLR